MFKKVTSIILYVFAGFLFYTSCFMAFIEFPEIPSYTKIFMIPLYLIIGVIPLLIGFKISGFKNWKRILGIVITSAAGGVIFIIISLLSILSDPTYKKIFAEQNLKMFEFDYLVGLSCTLIFGGIGIFLIFTSKKK